MVTSEYSDQKLFVISAFLPVHLASTLPHFSLIFLGSCIYFVKMNHIIVFAYFNCRMFNGDEGLMFKSEKIYHIKLGTDFDYLKKIHSKLKLEDFWFHIIQNLL